jgi:hypothetical protein
VIFTGVRIVNAAETELQQNGDRLNNEETDRDRRRGESFKGLSDASQTSPIYGRVLLDVSVADSNDKVNVDRDELQADEHNPDCHLERTIRAPEDKQNEQQPEIERLVSDIREKVTPGRGRWEMKDTTKRVYGKVKFTRVVSLFGME